MALLGVATAISLGGCEAGSDGTCTPGQPGCTCLTDGTCGSSYQCVANVCEGGDAPRPPDGETDAGTPVSCPELQAPGMGDVQVTGTDPDDVASYACDDGFGLVGAATRRCQLDGSWSGEVPTCAVDCGAPVAPEDGTVEVSDGTLLGATANCFRMW